MPIHILLILGALTAFGPLAIDFYLPGFPAIAAFYHTDIEHVGLSLSAYFAGIAIGQLIYGPIIDRFGRRKPLLIGITLFSVTSLACAFAPSLGWLIGLRFVQSLGGCAGMVIARTMVRDKCNHTQMARVFSQLMLVTGLAPMLAPLFGGWLLIAFSWQAIFVCLCIFSTLCLLATWQFLPESLPYDPLPLTNIWTRYWLIIKDQSFLVNALAGGLAMGGMFAYVSGSPFVFIELYHLPEHYYGWIFGTNALGFIVFGQINARLVVSKDRLFKWLFRSALGYVLCSLVLLLVALSKPPYLWMIVLPLFCCVSCLGGILPNATACALANQGSKAGSASGLLGSMQFCLAAIASAAVGVIHNNDAKAMAVIVFVCSCMTLLCIIYASKIKSNI